MNVEPAHVFLSASTSEAYAWLFSLLADADDAIFIPRPSYPLLSWIAASQKVRLVPYQLARDTGFRIDFDDLAQNIDERTRAIVLVHPNNPTGNFVRQEDATKLGRLAREHNLALVVDEVFGDYALSELPRGAVRTFAGFTGAPLTFAMSGLSKVLLLPQCKLGWTVVSGDSANVDEALSRLELIADTYLSVATPVQLALPTLLSHQPEVARAVLDRVRNDLASLDEALRAAGEAAPVRRLPVEGGWYAILEVPRVHDEDGWTLLLLERERILVHPGYFFDLDRDGFLVVSLLPECAEFAPAIERMIPLLCSG